MNTGTKHHFVYYRYKSLRAFNFSVSHKLWQPIWWKSAGSICFMKMNMIWKLLKTDWRTWRIFTSWWRWRRQLLTLWKQCWRNSDYVEAKEGDGWLGNMSISSFSGTTDKWSMWIFIQFFFCQSIYISTTYFYIIITFQTHVCSRIHIHGNRHWRSGTHTHAHTQIHKHWRGSERNTHISTQECRVWDQ